VLLYQFIPRKKVATILMMQIFSLNAETKAI